MPRPRQRGCATGWEPVFGRTHVFMDVDNLLAGQRFDRALEAALAETDVFLAVIGRRWMELLKAREASGERDFVREEIAAALARKIIVIPVLMDGASLPREDALPGDLRDLVMHHKHDLKHESFGRDAAALIENIKAVRMLKRDAERAARRKPVVIPWAAIKRIATWAGIGAAGLAAAVALVFIVQKLNTSEIFAAKPSATQKPQVTRTEPEKPPSRQTAAVAPPRPAPAPQTGEGACDDGLVVSVGLGREKPCIKPGSGQGFRDCADCPEMVVAPAGSYLRGSTDADVAALVKEHGKDTEQYWKRETPQRRVTIAKPFAVGRFSVTFAEWEACVAGGGCQTTKQPSDQGWGRADRPVINVSWDDAQEYVAWLSKKTGKSYRLLSEAEREYVARAGTTTQFWWGNVISTDKANYDGNYTHAGSQKGEYRQKTLPVKSFQPNPWGLYQVHGNVWEWVQDCFVDSYKTAPTDGSAVATGDCIVRFLRGGAWVDYPQNLRAADRSRYTTSNRSIDFGFRLARTL